MIMNEIYLLKLNNLNENMHNINMKMIRLEHYAFLNNDIKLYNEGLGEWIDSLIEWIKRIFKTIKDWIGKLIDFLLGGNNCLN